MLLLSPIHIYQIAIIIQVLNTIFTIKRQTREFYMENQQVTLFVRIDGQLKTQLENEAKEDRRSVASLLQQILKHRYEAENGAR